MDSYKNFIELKHHAAEGRDFRVETVIGTTGVVIMAPHGGGIEPGTAEIAKAIAGDDHSYYAFLGLKPINNTVLHIASQRFDEPRAVALAMQSHTVVSIHGCRTTEAMVYVGGLNSDLKNRITDALQEVGFQAGHSPNASLGGIHRKNLCNRGSSGQGVQLEISSFLRRQLIESGGWRLAQANDMLKAFVSAVRGVLAK